MRLEIYARPSTIRRAITRTKDNMHDMVHRKRGSQAFQVLNAYKGDNIDTRVGAFMLNEMAVLEKLEAALVTSESMRGK